METLVCRNIACQQEKPVSEFYRSSQNKSSYQYWCKACQVQRLKDVSTERYHMRRLEAVNALGGVCNRCGEADYRVLQIDHVHGGGRAEQRKLGSHGIYRKILDGAPGYQVLCANCHVLKTYHTEDVA